MLPHVINISDTGQEVKSWIDYCIKSGSEGIQTQDTVEEKADWVGEREGDHHENLREEDRPSPHLPCNYD